MRNIAENTLQQWGVTQRDAYITEMLDAFARLAEARQIAMSAEAVREGYRKFPQGSHIIFFRSSDTHGIEIVRVLHNRMDAEAHMSSP